MFLTGTTLHLTCLDGASLHLMWIAAQPYEQQPQDDYCCLPYSMEQSFSKRLYSLSQQICAFDETRSFSNSFASGHHCILSSTREPITPISLTFVHFLGLIFKALCTFTNNYLVPFRIILSEIERVNDTVSAAKVTEPRGKY
jgi:hypothetical protein